MRKIKLHLYKNYQPQINYDSVPEYKGSCPFSEDGIAKWCELVGPDEAEFFYCGQFSEKDDHLLRPERFEYFDGNEHKHIFDLEGDRVNMPVPQWLGMSILIAANASPEYRNLNLMVRPGCSMLLMDLVKRTRQKWMKPKRKGFYFRGQRDPHGIRENVKRALEMSGLPHFFQFMPSWNAMTPAQDQTVAIYEAEMREWSHILAPGGNGGGMTCRFFEACGLVRMPIVIARNWLFVEDSLRPPIMSPFIRAEQLAEWFKGQFRYGGIVEDECAEYFFDAKIREYFHDPTKYFLTWMSKMGLLTE